MARFKGILKLRGTLGGLTFYQRKDMKGATLVKQKNTLTKERIRTDPSFERTRENYHEFGRVNTIGAVIRRGAAVMLERAPDPSVTTRLVSTLSKVKQHDAVHGRGHRTAGEGLRTAAGRSLLRGFDFNGKSPLGSVLYCPIDLEADYGLAVAGLVPARMLDFPGGATHVAFRTGVLAVDVEGAASVLHCSPVVTVPLDSESTDLLLRPSGVPTGHGFWLWLVLIEFFQETNGEPYPLYDRSYNVLHLLDVGCA